MLQRVFDLGAYGHIVQTSVGPVSRVPQKSSWSETPNGSRGPVEPPEGAADAGGFCSVQGGLWPFESVGPRPRRQVEGKEEFHIVEMHKANTGAGSAIGL